MVVGLLLSGALAILRLPPVHGQSTTPTAPVIEESVPPESNNYPLGPDSLPNSSNPAGKTFQFELKSSNIFPNTTRTITVYIPAAYTGATPACLYVGLDGLGFNASTVFDNLIAERKMPITIGIGVSPGVVESADGKVDPRFDRSFEFDSRSDRLARFLLEEVIPAVERHPAPGGRAIVLSSDPNDRAIGGASTGGIGAFTVAWERPDAFRRVFSAIGTYVGMRGGEQYYVLVRKTEPRPLRIFMQDGVHDEWPGGPEMGDWWMSNQTMNRALEFAGYDLRHVWGAGTHNGNQAASIFPDAMRWLWRDWPAPVQAGASGNPVLQAISQPGQDWQLVATACAPSVGLAANVNGNVFYRSNAAEGVSPLPTSGNPVSCAQTNDGAFAFGPGGALYRARPQGGIAVAAGARKSATILAKGLLVRKFTVRNSRDIYAIAETPAGRSQLWLISSTGKATRLDEDAKGASALALSPDGLWLFVAQAGSRAGLSYRVRTDGTLDSREPFYDFYVPDWADDSGAASLGMDRDGRPYVATRMGIQIFDRNGRVSAILPLPGNHAATALSFGGPDFNYLYALSGDRIYRRRLHVAGAPPWAAPLKLPPWGPG